MHSLPSVSVICAGLLLAGCGSNDADGSGGADASGAASGNGGAGGEAGGGAADACATALEGGTLRLATGTTLEPGAEATVCQRWTVPEKHTNPVDPGDSRSTPVRIR